MFERVGWRVAASVLSRIDGMRESELRPVLLVKAIEESDREGAVIAPADRVAATREAVRAAPVAREALRLEGGRLPAGAQRLLVLRARTLLAQLRVRHPFVEELLAFASARWVAIALMAAALAMGLALSSLDGTRRINVLAFPLWGVVAWNLLVYAIVAIAALRAAARHRAPSRWLPAWTAHTVLQRGSALVARARRFHAPLANALARFLVEWQEAARPMLAARAARLFHVCAALLGAGLVAGFYLRGVTLDFRAGWESTFLDASQAQRVLAVLYAPASWLTGIAVPDTAHLEAIRWRDGAGGESAAPWLHLLAATVLVFVIVPRIALAIASAVGAWRAARSPALPASLAGYFDAVFREVGLSVAARAQRVIPYAYEPPPEALARLRDLLQAPLDMAPMLAYGREEDLAEPPDGAGGALLFTLASTPEDENHGRVIAAARRWRSAPVVIVDEGPYAARMGEGMKERVDERRRAWRQFVAAHGLEPRFVDLSK
jgi:uncharacterized protein DUF2868